MLSFFPASSFAALFYSFLIQQRRKKNAFPEQALTEELIVEKSFPDLGEPDDCLVACKNLFAMFPELEPLGRETLATLFTQHETQWHQNNSLHQEDGEQEDLRSDIQEDCSLRRQDSFPAMEDGSFSPKEGFLLREDRSSSGVAGISPREVTSSANEKVDCLEGGYSSPQRESASLREGNPTANGRVESPEGGASSPQRAIASQREGTLTANERRNCLRGYSPSQRESRSQREGTPSENERRECTRGGGEEDAPVVMGLDALSLALQENARDLQAHRQRESSLFSLHSRLGLKAEDCRLVGKIVQPRDSLVSQQEGSADDSSELQLDFFTASRKTADFFEALAWAASPETKVCFLTSGSTGRPKVCEHSFAMLAQDMLSVESFFTGCKRVISTVPSHHMYGFTFGLVLPALLAVPVVRELPLVSLLTKTMRPHDLVIGVPILWKLLAEHGGAGQGISLISASAPLSSTVMQSCLDQGFSIVEVFGSSELGQIGTRRKPEEPFMLAGHFTKASENELIRSLPQGGEDCFSLQDEFRWLGERSFFPCRRTDFAVQVAGVNVYPNKIARWLASIEGVLQCSVRLMRPDEGIRLKAFLVVDSLLDRKSFTKRLIERMRRELNPEERPRLTFGSSLPRNEMGKVADW